jgi:hypothetical protein
MYFKTSNPIRLLYIGQLPHLEEARIINELVVASELSLAILDTALQK